MNTISPDMLATMAFLRDSAPNTIGVHVANRPDITGDVLQRGIRFLFGQINTAPVPASVLAPVPTKPRAVKRGAVAGTAGSLLAAVNRVLRATARRDTIPILACLRVTVRDGIATISGTDMDRWMAETVEWNVPDCDGAVNGKLLRDTLKAMSPSSTVSCEKLPDTEHKDTKGTARTVPGSWRIGPATLAAADVNDFPIGTSPNFVTQWTMPAETLRKLLTRAAPCMSTEVARYYLNGVFLTWDGSDLCAVATDGHTMAIAKTPTPAGSESMPEQSGTDTRGIIIPLATVNDILALIAKESGDVSISATDTQIRIAFGQTVVLSKLVDGSFPSYQRVLPKRENEISVDTSGLLAAIRTASAVSGDRSPKVKFSIDSDCGIELSVNDTENGAALARVEYCTQTRVKPVVTAFQAPYLRRMLALMGERTWIGVPDDDCSPVLFGDAADPSVEFVIMPVRI